MPKDFEILDVTKHNFTQIYPDTIILEGETFRFTERCKCFQGGYGVVAEFEDENGELVAFKMPKVFNKEHLNEFRREIKFLKELSNIGQLKDLPCFLGDVAIGEVKARVNGKNVAIPVVRMERAESTVTDFLEKQDPSPQERLDVALQMAKAVKKMHKLGIASRDIKTDNFLIVRSDDGDLQVVIADLGFATRDKTSSEMVGTVEAMAPEMFDERYNCKEVDQHALLVTIAETLDPSFFNEGLSAQLLEKIGFADDNEDYESAQEFADEIRELAEQTIVDKLDEMGDSEDAQELRDYVEKLFVFEGPQDEMDDELDDEYDQSFEDQLDGDNFSQDHDQENRPPSPVERLRAGPRNPAPSNNYFQNPDKGLTVTSNREPSYARIKEQVSFGDRLRAKIGMDVPESPQRSRGMY